MKKNNLLLLLLFFFSFLGYSQLPTEGFENATFPPTGWTVFENGTSGDETWKATTSNVYNGSKSAQVLPENIGKGNTSEDWLVTPLTTMPQNPQLSFYARSFFQGDRGTKYQIWISSNAATNPKNIASYTMVKEYTSLELSQVSTVYEEKRLGLPALAGEQRFIAFVRVFTQPGDASSGDRWLLDNVSVSEQCLDPDTLGVLKANATTAVFTWQNPGGAPLFDVEYGLPGFVPETGTYVQKYTDVVSGFTATGLLPNTAGQYYVRSKCSSGVKGAWVGPFLFNTKRLGILCSESIVISQLPFQVNNDNTANYSDEVDVLQGTLCGASPSTANYLEGNDVFYSFTPTKSGPISIIMTPIGTTSTNSSVFVYTGCSNIGSSCVGGMANLNASVRTVNLTVTAGTTYTIVLSSSSITQTYTYNLMIQAEECTPKPTGLTATNMQLSSVDLSWTNAGFTSWQVEVQPLGSPIPSGDGTYYVTTNPTTTIPGLESGTQYQYWVRGECTQGSGVYTSWAGPYVFNTLVCSSDKTCTQIFRMTDSANNGWDGALMQIRQNGIVIATIGSTYTTALGAGPVDVAVPLCKETPYDIYWITKGTQPNQCILSIVNTFEQTIYTKAAGNIPSDNIVYSGTVNCDIPLCNIPPTKLTAVVDYHSANLSWSAPATSIWDIYVVPKGGVAPDATSTPMYSNVTANPFPISGLLADTSYDFYVRVVCTSSLMPSTGVSEWSLAGNFTTLPSCTKPKSSSVATTPAITSTTATFNWVSGTAGDSLWDILLVPSSTGTLPTQLPPANPSYPGQILLSNINSPSPYNAINLTPATIYFYYVRTVCSSSDSSTWTGPVKFNTLTCDPTYKCTYKFILTGSGTNGWAGGTMQVRQNGIVVATLGSTLSGAGPVTVNVALCPDVPFDLYWNNAGTAPAQIGVKIQNPFTDIIYSKLPGVGKPLDILYSSNDKGNCTPPICPKPTGLTVATATSTSSTADLSWTPGGGETQWELYVVPVGSPEPVNGSDVSGIPPYYLTQQGIPSYTVTGLLPSKNYTYYVRAICSPSEVGTWTILDPKTFVTKTENDDCSDAKPLTVNGTRTATVKESGNTFGATDSSLITSPACSGTTDDDIWFSFVATEKTHVINISNIVSNIKGVTQDVYHVLYLDSNNSCTGLTQLYCSIAKTSVATDLVPGNVYKIRVYTKDAVVGQAVTFDISITTPPPVTNDECGKAISAPVNNDLPCLVRSSGSLTGATASPEGGVCVGIPDDDVWFSFVANATHQYLQLINVVGSTTNINHAVYSGTCGDLVLKNCGTANSLIGNYDSFVIGQTYYVRVWSNAAVFQDVSFDLCIGKLAPPITTSITQYTNKALVEDVLLKTKCASVSNITSSTGIDFAAPSDVIMNGIGYFNRGDSGFPFKEGVILSTGSVLSAPGPNLAILSEGADIPWPGDADLEVSNPGMKGKNASKLEFDFIPLSNKISFNFLLASDEYGRWQCEYSDAFAFYLTNTVTGVTTNLAKVPGTNDIVCVTNIRDAIFNPACSSVHPEFFANYYGTPSPPGIDPNGAPINYNGLTVPMTAESVVTPGVRYHIKLVIADRLDTQYDSAVFIEGGSFNIGTVDLGPDLLGKNALCSGETKTLNSGLDPNIYTIYWTKDDITIPNEKGPNVVVSGPGDYAVWAQYDLTTSCVDKKDSIKIEYYQEPALGIPNDMNICSQNPSGVFNLTKNSSVILAPYLSDTSKQHTIAYFLSQSDADNNVGAIPNPSAFTNTSNPQTIYVRVSNDYISCYQTTSFKISSMDVTPKFTLGGAMAYCPQGFTTIAVVPTDNDFDPNTASYIWTFNGSPITGQNGSSLLISTDAGYGDYTVTVNNKGCVSTKTFTTTNSNTVWDVVIEGPATLCPTESGTLTVNVVDNTAGAPGTYTYTLPDSSTIVSANNTLTIQGPGTYSVNVDIYGCSSVTKSFVVGTSTANWDVTFLNTPYLVCPNQSVNLSFAANNFDINNPSAVYTWTKPDSTISTGATLLTDQLGTHNLEVDVYGCKSAKEVSVDVNTETVPIELLPGCDGNNFKLQANPVSASFDPEKAMYQWIGPDNGIIPGTSNTIIINAIGNYTVKVTTPDGCSSQESLYVGNVTCSIQKGISPNGDGYNESFELNDVKKLEIFNRYGIKVYSHSDYTNQWHGQTDDGKELPDGTYYYVVERNNGEVFTGWIYINR